MRRSDKNGDSRRGPITPRRPRRDTRRHHRHKINPNAPWLEKRRADAAGCLAKAERSQLFVMITRQCRKHIGRCFNPRTVTQEQRDELCGIVQAEARAAGLRIADTTIAGRICFWLRIHNPAKSLHWDVADTGRFYQIISSGLPRAELVAINEQHRDQLEGRKIDYYALCIAGPTIIKNSLVENHRTRKEEVGTKAVREMLCDAGINANGTFASLCFEIIANVGLIRCPDLDDFEKGTRCRRWIPVGAAWSLPFLANLKPEELSDAQRLERDKYLNPDAADNEPDDETVSQALPPELVQTWVGRSQRIRSA